MSRLGRDEYAVDPVTLAKRLLGCRLVRTLDDGARLSGVIVETEAYLGEVDRASHSFGGRRTAKNESMYLAPGAAYVYFTYGMHHCINVVCGSVDEPVAVLLRALEPTEGAEQMRIFRSAKARKSPLRDHDLCSGPGKLCQALAINREQDGVDLCNSNALFIEPSQIETSKTGPISVASRVGLGSAGEWTDHPLRFFLADSRHVSRK